MARPIRLQYPDAAYHVMSRGNHGQKIFADDKDPKTWLATLEEACDKTGWRVHAYVLMANHYHLLLQTVEPNLVDGMKWLQGAYTQRYTGGTSCGAISSRADTRRCRWRRRTTGRTLAW